MHLNTIKSVLKNRMVHVDFKNFLEMEEFFEDQDYIFHYTDDESALNILCDGFIYPYKSNSRDEHILLIKDKPYASDLSLLKHLHKEHSCYYINCYNRCRCNYSNKFPIGFRNRYSKLHYAFGFKFKHLKSSIKEIFLSVRHYYTVWEHKGKIDLRANEFILVYRDFVPNGFSGTVKKN